MIILILNMINMAILTMVRRRSGNKLPGRTSMDQLENRFIVLKRSDVDKYLSPHVHYLLRQIVGEISIGRDQDGKKHNKYVVVNLDEPYSQQVLDLVLGSGNLLPQGKDIS